ncbi:RNA polymerase-binding transcription factor DksA [Burkholderiaceae bacterium]|nr:RNA polymerase-binding transcription factor DksA [Burkholderiaceae bacterium]
MSKIPAKQATTKKPAAKTPAAKAPAKAASKTAAKPSAKPAAKPVAKPVAKPAGKAAAPKPAAKAAPAKPAAKAAPAPQPKPHAKPAAAVAAPAPKPAAPAPAPAPAKAPAPSSRASARYAAVPAAAPLPPPTSRFADRFAPPRPPTRQMNNLAVDTPKHAHKPDPKLANAWKTKAGRELTEEELLAMPDSEYMNDKQLEFFRARLQALKDDLLSNAGETTEHLREDTSIVPDPADRATIEEEHALELRTRDRERKLLKKISQSLARIDAGDYGFCDETGEPIGLGRLIARPTATLSLEAQQRRELKQKMFGD